MGLNSALLQRLSLADTWIRHLELCWTSSRFLQPQTWGKRRELCLCVMTALWDFMSKDLVIQTPKANKMTTAPSNERQKASAVLSHQVTAGAPCSFNKPLPRNKQEKRTSCLKPHCHQHSLCATEAPGQQNISSSLPVLEGLWMTRQEAAVCQLALKVLGESVTAP